MATNIFEGVQSANPRSSTFDLSHDRKYTMKAGRLTPIFCKPVLPGDTFRINTASVVRLIPMIGPVMHKIDMDVHWFYVPNRIIWKNWEKFITGAKLAGPEAGAVPVHPYLDYINVFAADQQVYLKTGGLMDYLGYPVTDNECTYPTGKTFKVNSLPLRAYYLIWKEWYRDQNMEPADQQWDAIFENDGHDISLLDDSLADWKQRAWEKDYFTSALPFVQKGNPMSIPLGTSAPVTPTSELRLEVTNGANPAVGALKIGSTIGNVQDSASANLRYRSGLSVNLTGASAATVNDLRAAFQAQIWLERNARAGTRYNESLLAHWGVVPADYRLQRPELFGAARVPVQISEVLQTSQTGTTPQGNMSGHGIAYGKDFSTVFCPEHGYIIGIASIKPRTSYMYAVDKTIFTLNYLDYPWPEFAHLGEQEVKRKELGFNKTALLAADIDKMEQTFGYQSRYAEYRSAMSTVHGGMRSDTVLQRWHMARNNVDYNTNLSATFTNADPTTRIFADTMPVYEYIVHTIFNVKAKRPLPYFADPGYIDHP